MTYSPPAIWEEIGHEGIGDQQTGLGTHLAGVGDEDHGETFLECTLILSVYGNNTVDAVITAKGLAAIKEAAPSHAQEARRLVIDRLTPEQIDQHR